jgi:uncharacterized Rmd1/YagE family protein
MNGRRFGKKDSQSKQNLQYDQSLIEGNKCTIPTTIPFPPSSSRSKHRHEPARTTKTSQKLVLFPEAEEHTPVNAVGLPEPDQENSLPFSEEDEQLRRVTAYLTAESYNLKNLLNFIKKQPNGELARRYDEVLYVPISISQEKEPSLNISQSGEEELDELVASDTAVGQVFYFEYGVTVIWGLSELAEKMVLAGVKPFENSPLEEDDVEEEIFQFCQSPDRVSPCLFNDIIMLRKASSKMLKLSISHALAQSAKLTYFEEVVETTILNTKDIPFNLAATGRIKLPRLAITKQIGELLITRINVNLVSNVLDTPEIFWTQQAWAPLYRTVRGYLEISQRVEVLNQRCMVINDMLDLLRDHSNSAHAETLEWIVIILISIEIILGLLELAIIVYYGIH